MKGLKYQKMVVIRFSKDKGNGERELRQVYFSSITKTIINNKNIDDVLDNSFHAILNKIDNWISAGPGWVIEPVDDYSG